MILLNHLHGRYQFDRSAVKRGDQCGPLSNTAESTPRTRCYNPLRRSNDPCNE